MQIMFWQQNSHQIQKREKIRENKIKEIFPPKLAARMPDHPIRRSPNYCSAVFLNIKFLKIIDFLCQWIIVNQKYDIYSESSLRFQPITILFFEHLLIYIPHCSKIWSFWTPAPQLKSNHKGKKKKKGRSFFQAFQICKLHLMGNADLCAFHVILRQPGLHWWSARAFKNWLYIVTVFVF